MQYTNHYGLRKPEAGDYVNINDLNYNSDVVDTQLYTLNSRIPAGTTYWKPAVWNGTSWIQPANNITLNNNLSINDTTINNSRNTTLNCAVYHTLDSNATESVYPIYLMFNTKYASDVTNSGVLHLFDTYALRNYVTGYGDSGELNTLRGVRLGVGHAGSGSGSPQTTNVYGIAFVPYAASGVITNLYCLHMGAPLTGGTVTNAWNIYQANTYTNFFNGNIGIKTNSPTYDLHLANDSAAKPSTNTWAVTSDIRAKTEITDADLDICLNIIKNLPLKRFGWKDEYLSVEQTPDRHKIGWIADDVEKFFPKSVEKRPFIRNKKIKRLKTDPATGETREIDDIESEVLHTDFKYLNSDQIIAAMYGAVQKLIKIVEEQDARIKVLESQLKKTV